MVNGFGTHGSPAPSQSSAGTSWQAMSSTGPAGLTPAAAPAATPEMASFPVWALQPRKESGAKAFSNKYPEYDGRGTIIAVLDSGIDPGAGGLQITSDGKRKIIERIDASGAGDVDTSKIGEVKNGVIKGLSHRDLRLPSDCLGFAPYRIGLKRAFSLYPTSVRDRIVQKRQQDTWDPAYRESLLKAVTKNVNTANNKDQPDPPSVMERWSKEDSEAAVEALSSIDKKFKESGGDVGPIYDVVLFHDGEYWNAIIDTSECGDLQRGVRLRSFRETGDFAPLTAEDQVNVSINVYDDGNILEIVSMCSSHGTHVASIAAANFPDEPEKNGLAPGAQIVAISIGDQRLHSMETGTALVRAMAHIMRAEHYKVDVINMSYGEHSHWSNSGRIGELIGEVINKHGIVWVVSAGNAGPALSTVGTPPDISTDTMIGVGAYVSPEMMTAMYASRDKLPATAYTWTSRGPTIDGGRGVTICAPGGAITSVPRFSLTCSLLMNGTSMASPHVCGAVAMLISGLKMLEIPYSPFSMKRALENSAVYLPNLCHFGQGQGLLQVEGAFEHLKKFSVSLERNVRFAVACNSSGAKGVHLRTSNAMTKTEASIKVEPVFLDAEHTPADQKINFNVKFALSCSADWVRHPEFLDLMYTARTFIIVVDPTVLEPGAHAAYIKAYDVSMPQKGAVFEVPIYVMKPEPVNERDPSVFRMENASFPPGAIRRHFLPVPRGATWALFKARAVVNTGASPNPSQATSSKYILHTVQLLPMKGVREVEHHKMFSLNDDGAFTYPIAIRGTDLLEVCLAKWWANFGMSNVSYSVEFHGIFPMCPELVFHAAKGIERLDLQCAVAHSEVQPEIKLKNSVQNHRPTESKVIPLGSRDIIPPSRPIYELLLTYNFSVTKATEITPQFPWMCDLLYESEFESQLWMLYNSHKQLVACGDAYAPRWAAKVEKEDYVLKAHVRSEKKELLEKLSDLPLLVSLKLSSPISMDYYTSFAQASVFGKKCSNGLSVAKGNNTQIFIAPITTSEKHLKAVTQGQFLEGTLSLPKDEYGKKCDTYTIRYILNEQAKKKERDPFASSAKKKDSPSIKEAIFEHKIGLLTKKENNCNSPEVKALFEELKADGDANQVQVRMARLASLKVDELFCITSEDDEYKRTRAEQLQEVLELTAFVLEHIRDEDVLAFCGTKSDPRPEAAEQKKECEKSKNWLVECLCKRGYALCALDRLDEAGDVMVRLVRLIDPTDSKVAAFAVIHAEKLRHCGRALKHLLHLLEAKPGVIDVEMKIVQMMEWSGWDRLAEITRDSVFVRYPDAYEPF